MSERFTPEAARRGNIHPPEQGESPVHAARPVDNTGDIISQTQATGAARQKKEPTVIVDEAYLAKTGEEMGTEEVNKRPDAQILKRTGDTATNMEAIERNIERQPLGIVERVGQTIQQVGEEIQGVGEEFTIEEHQRKVGERGFFGDSKGIPTSEALRHMNFYVGGTQVEAGTRLSWKNKSGDEVWGEVTQIILDPKAEGGARVLVKTPEGKETFKTLNALDSAITKDPSSVRIVTRKEWQGIVDGIALKKAEKAVKEAPVKTRAKRTVTEAPEIAKKRKGDKWARMAEEIGEMSDADVRADNARVAKAEEAQRNEKIRQAGFDEDQVDQTAVNIASRNDRLPGQGLHNALNAAERAIFEGPTVEIQDGKGNEFRLEGSSIKTGDFIAWTNLENGSPEIGKVQAIYKEKIGTQEAGVLIQKANGENRFITADALRLAADELEMKRVSRGEFKQSGPQEEAKPNRAAEAFARARKRVNEAGTRLSDAVRPIDWKAEGEQVAGMSKTEVAQANADFDVAEEAGLQEEAERAGVASPEALAARTARNEKIITRTGARVENAVMDAVTDTVYRGKTVEMPKEKAPDFMLEGTKVKTGDIISWTDVSTNEPIIGKVKEIYTEQNGSQEAGILIQKANGDYGFIRDHLLRHYAEELNIARGTKKDLQESAPEEEQTDEWSRRVVADKESMRPFEVVAANAAVEKRAKEKRDAEISKAGFDSVIQTTVNSMDEDLLTSAAGGDLLHKALGLMDAVREGKTVGIPMEKENEEDLPEIPDANILPAKATAKKPGLFSRIGGFLSGRSKEQGTATSLDQQPKKQFGGPLTEKQQETRIIIGELFSEKKLQDTVKQEVARRFSEAQRTGRPVKEETIVQDMQAEYAQRTRSLFAAGNNNPDAPERKILKILQNLSR